jgi:hypothetical protein
MRAIQWNGRAHNLDASLMPLAVQNSRGQQALGTKPPIMGAQGGIFPANVAQLNALTAQDITALQDFYNDTFGIVGNDTVANRVSKSLISSGSTKKVFVKPNLDCIGRFKLVACSANDEAFLSTS